MAELRTFRSKAFRAWYWNLKVQERRIVDSRVDNARFRGIFKNYSLYEFKWESGRRVYFSLLEDKNGDFMLLLCGGNKNSQTQDLVESKKNNY